MRSTRDEPQALTSCSTSSIQPSSSTASASSSSSRTRLGPPGDHPQLPLPAPARSDVRTQGAGLIHVSTDCVFPAGSRRAAIARRTEPDARDLYGLTKLLGEVKAPFLDRPYFDHRLGAGAGLRSPEWFAGQDGRPVDGFTERDLLRAYDEGSRRVMEKVCSSTPSSRACLPCRRGADLQVRPPVRCARRLTCGCTIRRGGRAPHQPRA